MHQHCDKKLIFVNFFCYDFLENIEKSFIAWHVLQNNMHSLINVFIQFRNFADQ